MFAKPKVMPNGTMEWTLQEITLLKKLADESKKTAPDRKLMEFAKQVQRDHLPHRTVLSVQCGVNKFWGNWTKRKAYTRTRKDGSKPDIGPGTVRAAVTTPQAPRLGADTWLIEFKDGLKILGAGPTPDSLLALLNEKAKTNIKNIGR